MIQQTIRHAGPVPLHQVPPMDSIIEQLARCRPMPVSATTHKINRVIACMIPDRDILNMDLRTAIEKHAHIGPPTARDYMRLARISGHIEKLGAGRKAFWRLTPRGIARHKEINQ
jgi:hypothetical protein